MGKMTILATAAVLVTWPRRVRAKVEAKALGKPAPVDPNEPKKKKKHFFFF
jgi:hypothetical protein